MKTVYPVIFTEVDTNILIEIPDLGILTEANEEGKDKWLPSKGEFHIFFMNLLALALDEC